VIDAYLGTDEEDEEIEENKNETTSQ
jgi:hypothetical protein